MAGYLENKINIQMEDISVKMNAMTCEATSKPVLATEVGYVNHSLDILEPTRWKLRITIIYHYTILKRIIKWEAYG